MNAAVQRQPARAPANDRLVRFDVFLGMNGSGKSYQMAKWRRINKRNLILPATRADNLWRGIPELKSKVVFRPDPLDHTGRRQRPIYYYPEINSFTGDRVVYIEGTDEERALQFGGIIHPNWGFHRGGLFLDDSKRYIQTKGTLPAAVAEFWGNRRQNQVDIFMAAWQWQHLNSDFYGFGGLQLWIGNVERAPTDMLVDNYPADKLQGLLAANERSRKVNAALPSNRRWHFEPWPNPPLK